MLWGFGEGWLGWDTEGQIWALLLHLHKLKAVVAAWL